MQRLQDIIVRGADKDVVRNLSAIATKLAELRQIVPVRPVDDFVGLSVKRLLAYEAQELNAASLCLRIDIHAFAWRVRNIFESFLLLEYITKSGSEQNAKLFVGQKLSDERTILDGILSLDSTNVLDKAALTDRKTKITNALARHGMAKATPWRVDYLAGQTNYSSEYSSFYKLYSKYVHPSAWTILSDKDEYDTKEHWEIFLLQAQLYGYMSQSSAESFLSTRGNFMRKDA